MKNCYFLLFLGWEGGWEWGRGMIFDGGRKDWRNIKISVIKCKRKKQRKLHIAIGRHDKKKFNENAIKDRRAIFLFIFLGNKHNIFGFYTCPRIHLRKTSCNTLRNHVKNGYELCLWLNLAGFSSILANGFEYYVWRGLYEQIHEEVFYNSGSDICVVVRFGCFP